MRRFASPCASRVWSATEVKQLRALTDAGIGVEIIAARLKRSVSAVRNKAGMHGFALVSCSQPAQPQELIGPYLPGSSA
jgi:hypothetical protein